MSVIFDSVWAEYQPVISSLAKEFGAKARTWGAEPDDFRHEFAIWILENQHKLEDKQTEIEDPDRFGKYLARCLRGEALDYMVDIKDQGGGQPRHGAYWYSVAEVKELLPSMFDPQKWHEPPQGEGKSNKSPAEGGNWIATLADISRAFDGLELDDRALLRAFHQQGSMNKELAKFYDVTEPTMSYRHDRAIKRLLVLLGDEKPRNMRDDVPNDPWRGRRAIGNSHARSIQSHYYEDE